METLADADAGDHPADEQPGQRRRQRHQHIIQREAEIRQQHHRPPAEPVRQAAEHWREQKLHQRPGGAEQAENPRRTRGIVIDEALHELGQDRHDQAEREHVEQNGDEDGGHRAAAAGHLGGGATIVLAGGSSVMSFAWGGVSGREMEPRVRPMAIGGATSKERERSSIVAASRKKAQREERRAQVRHFGGNSKCPGSRQSRNLQA